MDSCHTLFVPLARALAPVLANIGTTVHEKKYADLEGSFAAWDAAPSRYASFGSRTGISRRIDVGVEGASVVHHAREQAR